MTDRDVTKDLPRIPEGWRWRRVDDLAAPVDRAIIDGPFGSNLKTAHYTDAGPRVIRLQNIGDGEFIDAEAHISQAHFERLRAHEAKAGDVVVASLGETLPRACLVPDDLGPAIVKADCPRIRVGGDVRAEFLCAALNSPLVQQQAARLIAGVGRPRLNLSKLKQLLIPTPPMAEQDRIVEALQRCFERVDTGIDDLRDALARVPHLRAACLTAAFDEGDLAIHELHDLATIQSGITKSPPKESDLIAVPYIRTANVQAGYLDLKEIKELQVTKEQRARHLLQAGDVLVLEGGDVDKVGRGWIWADEVPGAIHQNHVFAVRPDPERLDSRYLAYYVNAPQARAYFLSKAKQTTNLASINKTQLRALPTPTPTVERQCEIVQRLDRELAATTALRQVVAERMIEAQALRRAVLAEAFQGRLVAPDPADEPASEMFQLVRDEAGAADLNTEGAAL